MKGFSGFGNSPAKQEDKQEKEKSETPSGTITTDKSSYAPGETAPDDEGEIKRTSYYPEGTKNKSKEDKKKDEKDQHDEKRKVRRGVAKGVASFIASQKRRQARKDEGAARVSEGISRAMSRKL